MATGSPTIFSPRRRAAVRSRMAARQRTTGAARWLFGEAVDDIEDRLAFLRHEPRRALVLGDPTGLLARDLAKRNVEVVEARPDWDDELPFREGGFDFIASLFRLDTANDLPGALVHLRAALAPRGLMITAMLGAGSLPLLRATMLAADGERAAPRLHPQVDVRAGGQLLMRAGFANPVIDTQTIERRYDSLDQLLADLRDQGLGNQLADPGPPLDRAGYARAVSEFRQRCEGGAGERFEVLTLTGWRH